jgi:hypothetical protein
MVKMERNTIALISDRISATTQQQLPPIYGIIDYASHARVGHVFQSFLLPADQPRAHKPDDQNG